jgi:hypothetical protein
MAVSIAMPARREAICFCEIFEIVEIADDFDIIVQLANLEKKRYFSSLVKRA